MLRGKNKNLGVSYLYVRCVSRVLFAGVELCKLQFLFYDTVRALENETFVTGFSSPLQKVSRMYEGEKNRHNQRVDFTALFLDLFYCSFMGNRTRDPARVPLVMGFIAVHCSVH